MKNNLDSHNNFRFIIVTGFLIVIFILFARFRSRGVALKSQNQNRPGVVVVVVVVWFLLPIITTP